MRSQESDRLEFPDLVEEYGEEAVRDAVSTLTTREAIGSATNSLKPKTIKSRIRGIDFFDRIRVFAAVENRTRGRSAVLKHLQKRREELEEIGERDDRLEDIERRDQDDDVDQEDEDPVWVHQPCGAIAERESPMAWFCPVCEQRTNRVDELDPSTVSDVSPGTIVADGGVSE